MANRGKKMNLGEFLGDKAAAYIPEAALPTGPRARDEFEDDRRGGFGDRRGGGDRGDRYGDREPSRSDQSDQWRGDRSGFSGGGDRGGGDRFGGPSRYDRPARDDFRSEERPASMRLNLTRRSDAPGSPRGGGGFQGRGDVRAGGSDDKFAGAFRSGGGGSGGLRFGDRGGDARFGDRGSDRFGDRGGDRFGDRGGDRFGGDRRGGDRYGDDRGSSDRFSSRFGNDRRDDDRGLSGAFGSMRVNEQQPQRAASPANEELDKKARAQKLREERKKKAEEERLAAEEAKKAALEAKKQAEEEAAQKAEGDRAIMAEVLASGKTGDELAKFAKDVFAKSGRPSGGVVVEAVTKQAEAVAKASANWIAPTQYGGLLKLALASAEVAEQVKALYALQVFLNAHDFPKGVLEKCFMALYTLDIIEEKAFFDYKYDVDNDAPGRMKAIVQTSNWLTWLETPEEGSDEEDDE